MLHYKPWQCLPSSAELPDSDDTPVDNEIQNLVPNLLLAILALIWQDRRETTTGGRGRTTTRVTDCQVKRKGDSS